MELNIHKRDKKDLIRCSYFLISNVTIITTSKTKKFVKAVMGILKMRLESITERITSAILNPKHSAAFSIQSKSFSLKNSLTTTWPGRNKTYAVPNIICKDVRKGIWKKINTRLDNIKDPIKK